MTDRPPSDALLDRARALYATEHGAVGGCLHIVLDDGNLEDDNVQFCIDTAAARGCLICGPLAVDLRVAPIDVRVEVYEKLWQS